MKTGVPEESGVRMMLDGHTSWWGTPTLLTKWMPVNTFLSWTPMSMLLPILDARTHGYLSLRRVLGIGVSQLFKLTSASSPRDIVIYTQKTKKYLRGTSTVPSSPATARAPGVAYSRWKTKLNVWQRRQGRLDDFLNDLAQGLPVSDRRGMNVCDPKDLEGMEYTGRVSKKVEEEGKRKKKKERRNNENYIIIRDNWYTATTVIASHTEMANQSSVPNWGVSFLVSIRKEGVKQVPMKEGDEENRQIGWIGVKNDGE
ncbi:hypothetical protein DFS33DRAFT_1455387 [Desarmillaria ectypa]|nr:hypothetical protein DFS33DRAFT_1455387 [Desarmillaria ectypa]